MKNKLSLWLMPPAHEQTRFARLIEQLSRRLGTPPFVPHITLLSCDSSEAEMEKRTRALAAELAPVPVQLTQVDYTDTYFRSLFIRAQLTDALTAAHANSARHFAQAPEADFLPHVSLVYGDVSIADKEKVIDDIGRRFDVHFVADRVSICVPQGSPTEWRLIGPFPLAGK